MMRSSRTWCARALSVVVGIAGCTPQTVPPPRSQAGGGEPAPSGFESWETQWLEQLGAIDGRLAKRTGVPPSAEALQKVAVRAVIRGDKDLGVFGGGLDPFAFVAREKELHDLGVDLVRQKDDGSVDSRHEKVLLGRLIEGEELRVLRERVSATSTSDRVRAIVTAWDDAKKGREVPEREVLIQRGLGDAAAELANGALAGPRGLELEDALDLLEHLAVPDGYPDATKLITALRVAIGKARPAATPPTTSRSLALDVQLGTYLGMGKDRERLLAQLGEEEAALRFDALARLNALSEAEQRDVRSLAAAHVDEESSCTAAVHARGKSVARGMRPPPERALVCEALLLAGEESNAREEVAALVALHDDVTIALWAIELDGGSGVVDRSRIAHRLIASVASDRESRLARAALVLPVRAIAPALAVAVLDAEGPGQRHERAVRWLSYGDAPLDVVLGYLGTKQP